MKVYSPILDYLVSHGVIEQIILIGANLIKKRRQRLPYCQIDTEQRRMLLFLVEKQGLIIKEAAQTLNINYSTAKTILQLYKKTGRIEKIETMPAMKTPIHQLGCETSGISLQQDSRLQMVLRGRQG